MPDIKNEFTNQQTAEQFEVVEGFNWNRKIMIPLKYDGLIQDIPPTIAEELIKQGRTDLVKKTL